MVVLEQHAQDVKREIDHAIRRSQVPRIRASKGTPVIDLISWRVADRGKVLDDT